MGRMVRALTSFGHTKFEVINFSECFHLQSALDSEFFALGCGHQLILVPLNFRSKMFWNPFIYRVLWTLNFSQRGLGTNCFLLTLNLRSNIFQNFFVYRVLWTLNFFQLGGIGTNFFWSH